MGVLEGVVDVVVVEVVEVDEGVLVVRTEVEVGVGVLVVSSGVSRPPVTL